MRLAVAGVAVELDGCPIVTDAELVVEAGEFVGLVGPNGCGKSTLLRSIYRALRPSAGLISLDGDDLWRLPGKEAARRVAVVAQEGPSDLDFTVEEVVALGRTPHKRPLDRDTASDRTICADALERVSMTSRAAPHPDEACDDRFPVSAQAHAGTCGQSADRRHSLRRCMVTVTRSAYVLVRCAVVCAVERARSTVRRQGRPENPHLTRD